jgi:dCTP deaminase
MAKEHGMIEPFFPSKVRTRDDNDSVPAIIYGLSSYGYDFTLADEIKVFVPKPGRVIDPKRFPVEVMEPVAVVTNGFERFVEIPPHSFALAHTQEYFRIPKNVLCIALGKSTYARCSAILNTTPFEPGWEGYVTLEITNSNPLPLRLYIGEGIGQVLFFEGDEPCMNDYGNGKYNKQKDKIEHARV